MTKQHNHTHEPVCPHCGHRERDAWEIDMGPGLDGDTEHTCNSCGEEYFLSRHCHVTYSSRPDVSCMMSYKIGHRDARHAAAELASHASAAESLGAATAEQQMGAVREALVIAEAALADIGDADRELGDDLAWCERRAAEALPAVRAALAAPGAPALDTARIDWLASEANDLRAVSTSEDDFAWQVIGHYEAEPRARQLSLHHDIRMAIDEARAIKSADDIAEAPESVEEAFERGRQQGKDEVYALWGLARDGQEIDAQCDGCLRGLPVVSGGMHRADGEWPFACTALDHRRRESAEAMRLAVRDLECPPDPEIVDRAAAQPEALAVEPEPCPTPRMCEYGGCWQKCAQPEALDQIQDAFESAEKEDDAVRALTEEGWVWDGDQWQRPPQPETLAVPAGWLEKAMGLAMSYGTASWALGFATGAVRSLDEPRAEAGNRLDVLRAHLTAATTAPAVREPLLTPEQIAALWHASTPSWPAGISLSDFKLVAEVIEPAFRAACGIQGKP